MWADSLNLMEVTLPSPEENLALDEALLRAADEQAAGFCLRIWESAQYAVVLGSSGRVQDDVHVARCQADGIPILRRCSGGGTVLLGPGSLVYSLVLPIDADRHLYGITEATAEILNRLTAPLKSRVPTLATCGTSDLAIDGRKISGNSQRWMRRAMLHHGTLLYDFPIERISRYLTLPKLRPDYRNDRNHADFLTNLPIARAELIKVLIQAWNARGTASDLPLGLVQQLVETKYTQDEWNFRL